MTHTDPPPHLRLEIQSQARLLSTVRATLSTLTRRLGFDDLQSGQIALAVDEALCNIINHGYERRPDGRIWISLWELETNPPGVRIVIEDEAKPVDPQDIQPRDLDNLRPGGLGVFIIREVMDEVTYEKRDGRGMRITMTKHAEPSETPNAEAATPKGQMSYGHR